MVPLVLSPSRHAALTACLAENVPAMAGSQHFTVYRLEPAEHTGTAGPEVVVVHSFSPAQIDNNIGYYVANELLPLLNATGFQPLRNAPSLDPFAYDLQMVFEQCVGAIVRSVDGNEQRAWHRFYANSLAALEQAMAEPASVPDFIWPFGAIYRRVCELVQGESLLDAGTCFGFLPLLLARQGYGDGEPGRGLLNTPLARLVGCDMDNALIGFANAYAARQGYEQTWFVQADILADDFRRLGSFDTVTAIHVIEHLEPAQTVTALTNLWRVAARRLVIAVPLEEQPDPRFGHRQVFNEERLLTLGRQLEGRCRYFELHGGWLVVEREAA